MRTHHRAFHLHRREMEGQVVLPQLQSKLYQVQLRDFGKEASLVPLLRALTFLKKKKQSLQYIIKKKKKVLKKPHVLQLLRIHIY